MNGFHFKIVQKVNAILIQTRVPGCSIGVTGFSIQANSAQTFTKFSVFYWIYLLLILLALMGVELLLFFAVTLS